MSWINITGAAGGGGQTFSLNGSTGSVSLVAGANITLNSGASSITIIGPSPSAGGVQTISGVGTSISGTAISLDLEAGPFISLQTATGLGSMSFTVSGSNQSVLYSISSIAGGTTSGTAATASSTAFQLVAGANILLSQLSTSPSITIAQRAGVVSLNGSSNSLSISAGAGIGIGQAASTITISYSGTSNFTGISFSGNTTTAPGSSSTAFSGNSLLYSVAGILSMSGANNAGGGTITLSVPAPPTATDFSLNGTSSSVSISAGAGINVGQAASTITISYSGTSNFTGLSFSGNTTTAAGSSATAFSGNSLLWSAAGILSMSGTTNAAGGTITLSVPAPAVTNVVTSLNGSNGSISVSAGAGIGIGQAASTITISASIQTSSLSVTGLGNTLGVASTSIAISNALNISGAGIVSVGMNGSTITISATTPSFPSVVTSLNGSNGSISISAGAGIGIGQAASTITVSASVQTSSLSISALGNTLGALSTSLAISNVLNISGAGVISIGMNGSTITISAPAAAVGSVSLTALGNTTSSSAGTFNNLLNFSGAGLASVGVGNGSVTISVTSPPVGLSSLQISSGNTSGATTNITSGGFTLVGGNNITLSQAAAVITISDGGLSRISYTAPIPLNEIAGTVISTSGTVTGLSTSLFLQRIMIGAPIALSEVDIAMSINFPATSQGAGTMSRSFVLYSFGNSTSISSVFSTSGASVWSTGTSTTAGAVSLTQFQGGWSTPLIQPMTFASTLIPAGEYVIGQMFNFGQGSSTWTVNLYGPVANTTNLVSAATALTSATLGAQSSGGLLAGSVHTASSSSSLTAWSVAPTNLAGMGSSGLSSFGSALRLVSFTNSTTALTIGATAVGGAVSGLGAISTGTFTTLAGSFHTASASGNVFSNAGTSAFAGFLGSGGLLAGSFVTASGSISALTNVGLAALGSTTLANTALPNFGFIGTGSTTSGIPTNFIAGIFGLGTTVFPGSIALTSAAVTQSGSAAFQQPWYALCGS